MPPDIARAVVTLAKMAWLFVMRISVSPPVREMSHPLSYQMSLFSIRMAALARARASSNKVAS